MDEIAGGWVYNSEKIDSKLCNFRDKWQYEKK